MRNIIAGLLGFAGFVFITFKGIASILFFIVALFSTSLVMAIGSTVIFWIVCALAGWLLIFLAAIIATDD